MTVPIQTPRVIHTANGVQDTFAYDFLVLDESHLKVYENAVLTTKAYTVTGVGNVSGGTVVFSPVVPANLTTVSLVREVPLDQNVDYQPYDPFPAETHEGALDKLTQQNQQQQDEIDRSLKAGIDTPPGVSYGLPPPEQARGLYWEDVVSPTNIVNGPTVTEIEADKNAAAASAAAAATSAGQASSSASAAATSASNAATSETNAATSESNASTSETNASASETKASQWADNPEDTPVETGPDRYSALHWAAKAQKWSQHDLAGGFFFTPDASVIVTRFVCASPFNLPINLTGSQGVTRTPPSADIDFDIQKNQVSVGTMTVTAAGAVTFVMAVAQSFAAGDVLEVVAPATLNGIAQTAYTLKGSLV